MDTSIANGVALLSVAMLLWAVVHSLTAGQRAKQFADKLLGKKVSDRVYRLAYNIFSGVSFLPIIVLLGLLPDVELYVLPPLLMVLTVPLQLAALLMLAIVVLQVDVLHFLGLRQLLGQPQKPWNEQKNAGQLVVSGAYAWVRHPLYFFSMAFLWLAPIMTVNLVVFNLWVTAYFYVGSIFEERKLVREFGDAYRVHQKRVPRLLPWPPQWQRK